MPGEDSVFDPGAVLSPTFGAAASAIEQAIMLATPNQYRGMVIRDNTPPQVTGEPSGYPTNWYAFQIRSIWVNDQGEAYFHDGTTWEYIRCRPAFNSITNDMIEDGSLMLVKLSSFGGATNQLIRVRAAGGFEYVDAINTIAPNTLPIDRVVSPSTPAVSLLQSISGVKSWVTFDSPFITGALSNNSVPIDKLVRGSALQVPMVAADGNSVTWSGVVASIADHSVPLSKISKISADAGKWLRIQPDGSTAPETLTIPTPAGVSYASSAEVAAGTETAKAISPATASSIPGLIKAKLVAHIHVGTGGISSASLIEAYNVASVSVVGATGALRVTFATPLPSDDYAIAAMMDDYLVQVRSVTNRSVNSFDIGAYSAGNVSNKPFNIIIA